MLDSLPDYIASIESNISAAHEIFDILFPSFISAEPKAHLPAANEPPRQALAEEADSVEWEDGGVEVSTDVFVFNSIRMRSCIELILVIIGYTLVGRHEDQSIE